MTLKQIAKQVCDEFGVTWSEILRKNQRIAYNHEREDEAERLTILKAKKEFVQRALGHHTREQVSLFLGYGKKSFGALKALLEQSEVISWYANNGGRYSKDHVKESRNTRFLNDSSICEYVFG